MRARGGALESALKEAECREAALIDQLSEGVVLATLVRRLKASRPGALLLDGGDTWQGSATALWTKAQDMVDACIALGVDVMTPHWEATYGAERVKEIVEKEVDYLRRLGVPRAVAIHPATVGMIGS